MNTPVRVLVTGVGGGGHGEQIIKALRLSDISYWILGTDIMQNSSGFTMVDETEVIPPATDPDYINVILQLCEKRDIQAVFHGSEPEMYALSNARDKFRSKGIYLPINPDHVLKICRDKVRTVKFLKSEGFLPPEVTEISSISDLYKFNTFPAVVKPSVKGGGSMNVYIVQDRDELENIALYLLRSLPFFLVQEYVGSIEDEYTVGVMFSSNGKLLSSICLRRNLSTALSIRVRVKNRTERNELGHYLAVSSGVSQGQIGRWPVVTKQCEDIARRLKPTAPINIQCRLVDGVVKVFEINPRFSGTTSIRAMVGYNEPDTLIRRDVLKENIEPGYWYRESIIMRGLAEFDTSNIISKKHDDRNY